MLISLGFAYTANTANAQSSYTWGGTTTGTWDTTATNWTGASGTPWDVSGGPGNTAVFNTASLSATVSDTVYARGITFTQPGALSGGTIALAGTSTSPGVITINHTKASGTSTINSLIAGSNGLTIESSANGAVTFTAANSYTGDTIVSGQSHSNYSGDPSLILQSTTGPAIQSARLYIGRATNTGHAAVDTRAANQFGDNTVLYFNGGNYSYLNMYGNDQKVAGLQSFNGLTTLFGTIQPHEFFATNGCTLTVNTATGTSYSFNGIIRDNTTAPIGVLSLIKDGLGTQRLGGRPYYTGTTTIKAGRLELANLTNASGSQASMVSPVNFFPGSTLAYNGASGQSAMVLLTGTGTFEVNTTGASDIYDPFWSATNKTVSLAAGSLIDVQRGTLRLGYGYTVDWTNNLSELKVASGATFDLWEVPRSVGVRFGALNGAGTVTIGAGSTTLYVGQGDATGGSFSGTITQAATRVLALIKTGTGTQALAGSNTYTGATTINAGTLQIGSGGSTGSLSTSSAISGSAGATLAFRRTNTVTQGTDFNAVIGGAINVSQLGSGTLVLNGANTYTGTTTVSAGSLQIGNDAALGSGTVTLAGGALSSNGATARSLANALGVNADTTLGDATNTGLLTFNGGVNLGGAARQITTPSNVTFAGAVTNGGLTKAGAGTLTLSANNTYAGTTTVNAGTLALTGAGALASTGTVNVAASGAGFDISGISASGLTIGSLSGSAGSVVALGGKSLTVGDATSTTFAGGIAGTGGLTKAGAGTLTLSAANTYAGTTTISGGRLALTGAGSIGSGGLSLGTAGVFDLGGLTSGTYSLPATGDLVGSGTLLGNGKTLAVLGSFLPGNSPGTVTVDTGFTLDLASSGTSLFEITSPGYEPGTYDLVNGGGNVVFGGVLQLVFSNGPYAVGSSVLALFANTGSLSGTFSSVQASGLGAGQSATFDSTTGYVTIVPEPAGFVVASLGIAAALWAKRRRRPQA